MEIRFTLVNKDAVYVTTTWLLIRAQAFPRSWSTSYDLGSSAVVSCSLFGKGRVKELTNASPKAAWQH